MCDQTPVSRNIKDDGPLNRYVKRDDVVVEHETLKKLKHKDERALEWFIDRYAAYVNTIIYNIIGLSVSAADIEEVSSDVFFTLWMNAKNRSERFSCVTITIISPSRKFQRKWASMHPQ